MKRVMIKSRIIMLLVAATLIMSGVSTYASSGTKITGYNTPGTMTVGQKFYMKGKISSNKVIKRVEVGVTYSSGTKWTAQKYDNKSVNAKNFDIGKYADPKIKFGKLKAGTYYYRIYAHTSDNRVHTLLNKKFVVKAKAKSNTGVVTSKTTKTAATSKAKAASKVTSKVNTNNKTKLVISGGNKPSNYKVGKAFKAKGIIKSDEKINRVEIGIIYAPTNKWTEYKYDKKGINAKTFDISKAASTLKFDKLPGGKYRYRIYVHTASGVKTAQNCVFDVTPSGKPKAAVAWAKKIAADDSFAYGKKPAASNVGCYFCGTNHGPVRYHKPKGYEKTYVCLTFLGAAYAHGAKDAEILKQCKKGRMTMYSNNDNFKKFSCWMKLGSCRSVPFDALQPGDVIVDWSSDNGHGHVWMYIGGDSYVDAGYSGWGSDTIAVRGGAKSYYKYMGKETTSNYVMRYRY